MLIVFLRDIHEGNLSLKDADDEPSNFAAKIGKTTIEKKFLLNNLGLLFSAKENVLNNFKSGLIVIKNLDKISTREPTTEQTKQKKSKLKLQQEFTTEIITKKINK